MTTDYIITAEMKYHLDRRIHYWFQRAARHREYTPVVERGGFTAFEEYWYNIPRPFVPQETRDLGQVKREIARLERSTAKVVFHSVDLNIPWATLQVSRAGGFDIQDISLQAAIKQLAFKEAEFVHRGATTPSITAMAGGAGNESTDTTNKWGTAPGASNVVQDMKGKLVEDGFDGPYDLIVSDGLAPDLDNFINAAPVSDIRERHSIAGLLGQERLYSPYVYKALPAAPDKKTIYPLPTYTNDGYAFLVQSDPEHFELIVEQPLTTIFGEFNVEARAWPILVFQALSFRIWEANSICKHTQVDLAA